MAKSVKSPAKKIAKHITRTIKRGETGKLRKLMPEAAKEANDYDGLKGKATGTTLWASIKHVMKEKYKGDKQRTNLQKAAEVFVDQMVEEKEFPFFKEFLERENGKVPVKVDFEGTVPKMYGKNVPTEGPNAP
jgi:hypothetical protein